MTKILRFLRDHPLHPFLLSVNAVLNVWLPNLDQVEPYVVLLPLFIFLLIATVLVLPLKLIYKDVNKASLLASVFVFTFSSFRPILSLIPVLPLKLNPSSIYLVLMILIVVGTGILLFRNRSIHSDITVFLNLLSILWVASSAFQVGLKEYERATFGNGRLRSNPMTASDAQVPNKDRDAYYIILDGYGRQDELTAEYGFDNSAFTEELVQLGFKIPECTLSNYAFTSLSLASSLNMKYFDAAEFKETESTRRFPFNKVAGYINYSLVREKFEALGYKIIGTDNGIRWAGTPGADDVSNKKGWQYNLIDFNSVVFGRTILSGLSPNWAANFLGPYDLIMSGKSKYDRINEQFDAMKAIPADPEKTFTFIHILEPHAPFVFTADGSYEDAPVASAVSSPDLYRQQYNNQVQYINRRIVEGIKTILEESSTPPIIILQGDHSWALGVQTQHQILNAYYLPDGGTKKLYSGITPVNSFRLVFDYYFGEKNGFLEDHAFFSALGDSPFLFSEYPANCERLPEDKYTTLFSEPQMVNFLPVPTAFLTGDVNGDKKADALFFTEKGVLVSLFDIDQFSRPTYWLEFVTGSTGPGVRYSLADVNGDGKVDLVSASPEEIIVALSNGTAFEPFQLWSIFESEPDLKISSIVQNKFADVNGDGYSDLVLLTDVGVTASLSDGTRFKPAVVWAGQFNVGKDWKTSWPIVLGDVNGDQKDDVVGFASGGVIVSLSGATGGGSPAYWSVSFNSAGGWQEDWPRLLADVNGDRKSDIVGYVPGGVVVSLSTGEHFDANYYWTKETNSSQVLGTDPQIGDANGDGKADLVLFAQGSLQALFSNGETFLPPQSLSRNIEVTTGWPASWSQKTGDVNGDGRSDIVLLADSGIHVSLSNGSGFDPLTTWTKDFTTAGEQQSLFSYQLADVNGDGKDDLIYFPPGGVIVMLSEGQKFGLSAYWTRSFKSADGWLASWPIEIVDVDGDKMADIVGFSPGGVLISLSDGRKFGADAYWTQAFTIGVDWQESWPRMIGDVNADGKADLVGISDQGVIVSLSNGHGFDPGNIWLHKVGLLKDLDSSWQMKLVDLNGDGRSDLFGVTPKGAYIALSTGEKFLPSWNYWPIKLANPEESSETQDLVFGDINGDGKLDILGFGAESFVYGYGELP